MSRKASLFELIGGLPKLERVHKRFYDKVYAHAWLGCFFAGHDQKAIELRQSLLRQSLEEEYVPEQLIERWLKIDHAFWRQIKNDSLTSFQDIDLKYERAMIVPNLERSDANDVR